MTNPRDALSAIHTEAARLATHPLRDLVGQEAMGRFAHLEGAGVFLDVSRHRLDEAAWKALFAYGRAMDIEGWRERLFSGGHVNSSEDRAALHWAIRSDGVGQLSEDLRTAVSEGTRAARAFAEAVRGETLTGLTGEPFRNIVHIGIGGSDFGPRLLADAFQREQDERYTFRFAANTDPEDMARALTGLDPAETLVIGVSKSFSTQETLYNLTTARDWLRAGLGEDDVSAHLALVTSRPDKARDWAGGEVSSFHLPDEIGGRYSIWSAASLSCAIVLGPDIMDDFQSGAAEMDAHTESAALEDCLPLRLAFLDLWNASFLNEGLRVVVSYTHRLRLLTTYLQQLEMESNGKSVSPDGTGLALPTAPALMGGEGTIGQHSYHQWLHQGRGAPVEFVIARDPSADAEGQRALLANALAQSRALLEGRDAAAVEASLRSAGASPSAGEIAQRVMPGNRPSTLLISETSDAAMLGRLIALYEHRTAFAGALWNINPFDQWGVELGKVMATGIGADLEQGSLDPAYDPATAALVRRFQN